MVKLYNKALMEETTLYNSAKGGPLDDFLLDVTYNVAHFLFFLTFSHLTRIIQPHKIAPFV